MREVTAKVPGRSGDIQTDGQRHSPWHCPQSTVRVITLLSLWDSGTHGRGRLASEPPSQAPSHYSLPHSSISFIPLTIPLSPNSPSLHNFLPLFCEQEGQKSRLLVTGTVLPWSRGKKKKGRKLGHCPGRMKQGLLCAAEWIEAGEGDRKRGVQVDGYVVCSGVRCPSLLINRLPPEPVGLSSFPTAVFDYIDYWQEIIRGSSPFRAMKLH